MRFSALALGIASFFTAMGSGTASDNQPIPGLVCYDLKVLGQSQSVPNLVTVTVDSNWDERPIRILVDNLPEGSGLKMNFQDVFGLGKEPDGNVIFAPRDRGDGTIQDVCGEEKFNSLFNVTISNKNYCAVCAEI